MKKNRAKNKLKELKRVAHRDGDGFIGFYFSREEQAFNGTVEGITKQEGAFIIKKLVEQMRLSPQQLIQVVYTDGETLQ